MHSGIVADRLSKSYFSDGKEKRALQDVTLQIPSGTIFALLGPNGAGKTTLVQILSTILTPDSGAASILGMDLVSNAPSIRKSLGYVGQDSERSGYERLTVRENLLYFAQAFRMIPRKRAMEAAEQLLSSFGQTALLDKMFGALSGGERQCVVVARSLLHLPNIVFLDEPTRSLDPITAQRVRQHLRGYTNNGGTVFLTTHNLQELESIADEIGFLSDGRLLFTGGVEQFKRKALAHTDVITIFPSPPVAVRQTIATCNAVLHTEERDSFVVYTRNLQTCLEATLPYIKGEQLSIRRATVEDAFIRLALGEHNND